MRSRVKSKRIKMPKYDTGKRTIDQMLKEPAQMQGSYAAVGNPGGYTWAYPEAKDGPVITPYGNYQDSGEYNRWHDLSAYDPNAPFEMFNQFVFGAPFALYDTADQAIKGTYGTPKAETPAQNLMGNVATAISPSRWAETARQGVYNQRWVSPWSEENAGIMQDPNLSNTLDLLLLHGAGNSTRLANAKEIVGKKAGQIGRGVKQAALNTVGDALRRYLIWRDLKNPRRLGFNSTEPAWEWADAKDITNGEKPSLKARVQDAVSSGLDYAKQKVQDRVNTTRTSLANKYPGLFDPYTTFRGSLGYYGNSFASRLYNTVARNLGFKGTPNMPELIRSERRGVNFNGYGNSVDNKTQRFPWINTTTDHIVRPHSKGNWNGYDVVIIDGKAYPAENYLSTTPGDTFILNDGVNVDPKQVTVVSGNPSVLAKSKNAGYETLSSPMLRDIYSRNEELFRDADSNIESAGGFKLSKGSNDTRFNPNRREYTDEIQRLINKRGVPTERDYQYQSEKTGLPISFKQTNGNMRPMTDDPGHVTYEISPPSEARLRETLGMDARGRIYNDKNYSNSDIRNQAIKNAYRDYGQHLNIPNASPEHTVEIQPTVERKQKRLQLQKPTYYMYTGPTHKISEVVNEDGTVNLKNLLNIQREVLQHIPGGTTAQHVLENQTHSKTGWNTALRTRDAYRRALGANYPLEYLFATLMYNAGKLWADDGYGPFGASIVKQVFPEATRDQIDAIYHHAEQNPSSIPAQLIKGVDIAEDNKFRPIFMPLGIIDRYDTPNRKTFIPMTSYQVHNNPTLHYTVYPIGGDGLSKNRVWRTGKGVIFKSYSSADGYAEKDPQLFADLYQMRRKAMNSMYSGDRLIENNGYSVNIKNGKPIIQGDPSLLNPFEKAYHYEPYMLRQMLERYKHSLNFDYVNNPGSIDDIRTVGRELYGVERLDPFIVSWMNNVPKSDYYNFITSQRRPSVFHSIPYEGLTKPTEMSRAIRLQEYIDDFNLNDITTTDAIRPQIYGDYEKGFKIGDIQTSDDVINFAKNTIPKDWKFEVPKSVPVYGTEKPTLGGYHVQSTGENHVNVHLPSSLNRDLQSTVLHETVSHGTDDMVKDVSDKYDVSKYNDNKGNIGEEKWYETRSTSKEVLFKLGRSLKTFDKDKLKKYVDSMSDDSIISLYESVNGYGQHYKRWYGNLKGKEKSEFVAKLRKIMFLPSVIGVLYNNQNENEK